ncbi:hypothetical protein OV450_3423 [Actinobacteria bacterium OV450]|nr:hypothetical protein OV450_3423 [Actinobacteria bacterium OV450]
MAALSTQNLSYTTGAGPTFGAAATANDCEAPSRPGQMYVHFKNTNAATRTVTVTVPGDNAYGAANPDPSYTLAADTGELLIPLHPSYMNSSGRVDIALSAATNVTVAVVKLPS